MEFSPSVYIYNETVKPDAQISFKKRNHRESRGKETWGLM